MGEELVYRVISFMGETIRLMVFALGELRQEWRDRWIYIYSWCSVAGFHTLRSNVRGKNPTSADHGLI